MGTSRSGTGPASNIPLIPPWVPEIEPDVYDGETDTDNEQASDVPPVEELQAHELASSARFGPARTSLGSFARHGETHEMRRAVGHYVRKGLGGTDFAVRRMGGTVRTASTLYAVLSTIASGGTSSILDQTLLAGRSVDEILDALIEAVRPIDGSQDSELGQRSISDSIADLLNRFPDADLLNLSEDQRLLVIEGYVAYDIYNRFVIDLGKTIHARAPNHLAALSRLKDIKEYVKEVVSERFRSLRRTGTHPTPPSIMQMVQQALRETFDVFEEYVK